MFNKYLFALYNAQGNTSLFRVPPLAEMSSKEKYSKAHKGGGHSKHTSDKSSSKSGGQGSGGGGGNDRGGPSRPLSPGQMIQEAQHMLANLYGHSARSRSLVIIKLVPYPCVT